jgi:hypothetical protein
MKVELTYFKESGKYYTSAEYDTTQRWMFEIFDEVRQWKEEKIKLPGLIGTWSGPILVEVPEHEHNHPALIL